MPFSLSLAFTILLGLTRSAPTPSQSLETVLNRWESANKAINTLSANVTRTTLDKAFQMTDVFEGTVKYMRPNLGCLRLARKDKPEKYEEYGLTGKHMYLDAPANKTRYIAEMPPSWSGKQRPAVAASREVTDPGFWLFGSSDWPFDSGPMPFLFGMKATEARRRYELALLKADDRWYHYILIKPKRAADRWWFSKARLVLNKETHHIRQLWYECGASEVTWDFTQMHTQIALDCKQFVKPPLPKGWTREPVAH